MSSGTAQASMSGNPVGNAADLDHDAAVGLGDWPLWADDWLRDQVLRDSDLDRDGVVDMADVAMFAGQWLWMEE